MPKIKHLLEIHTNVMDKQDELHKKSTIYSTKKIQELADAILEGGKPDTTPFFHGQLEWREHGIIFEYTDEELEELDKCANDCEYFVANYCKFLNSKGRTLVKLRDYQSRILKVMGAEKWDPKTETVVPEHPQIVLMLARQTSKTTTTAAFLSYYICFHTDRNVFICANKGRTAIEIMNKVKEVLEGLPYFLKPGVISVANERIKFENGCSIKCAAASSSPATGDSILLLYIDEAALIPENIIEEYWASVIPTMSSFTNSLIIVSSTPRGKGNRFFKIVDGAINKENNFYYLRVDWWEVPGHDEEWAEKQKSILGEELFNREFGLSFETAGSRLLSSWSVLFSNKIALEFVNREFYMVPDEISSKIKWAPEFNPALLTYLELKNRRFLLVVDTALGIEAGTTSKKDSDYNVINIFEIELMSPAKIEINRDDRPISIKDCVQYKQVGIYIDNIKDEAMCAEAAKFITFLIFKCGLNDIDNTRVLIEMNFNGNNWITKFKTHPSFYDPVIIKTVRGVLKPGLSNLQMKLQYGFRTTGGSHGKNYYCELGASMIHKRQIILRQIDDDINKSTIGLICQYGKNSKGSYEGTCCHDDIAVTCLFVSIALESKQFIVWLQEWMTYLHGYKASKIQDMLMMYVEKEALISNEFFHAFYQAAGATFGKLTHKQNGYGSIMNGELPSNYEPNRNVQGYQHYNGGYNNGGYSGYNNGHGGGGFF